MRYSNRKIYKFLELFADKSAHKFIDQNQIYAIIMKEHMVDIARYAMHNGWIVGIGRSFLYSPLAFKHFILTEKGDIYFRHMSILSGGDEQYYKYYDRDPNNTKFDQNIKTSDF